MIAFHGDPKIKAEYLGRLRAHAKADEIVKGQYWEDGKGCAVGCTIHGSTHKKYETELGIPEMLARLEDTIFEGLRSGEAKKFPERFLKAAKPGADLSGVGWQFLHWLLTEELSGRNHPLVKDAVNRCADVIEPLTRGEKVKAEAARSAAAAARSAAAAAWSAAEAAAWSADAADRAVSASRSAAARSAAWSADAASDRAVSASRSAEAAAEAVRSAAWSAAADAAVSASRSAEAATYIRMANKLIELMESVK